MPAISATAVDFIQPRTMNPPVQMTTATLAIATSASVGTIETAGGLRNQLTSCTVGSVSFLADRKGRPHRVGQAIKTWVSDAHPTTSPLADHEGRHCNSFFPGRP